jgi:hypothetical protein
VGRALGGTAATLATAPRFQCPADVHPSCWDRILNPSSSWSPAHRQGADLYDVSASVRSA